MPYRHSREKINATTKIWVQVSPQTKIEERDQKGTWYATWKFPDMNAIEKALGIQYANGKQLNYEMARKKAEDMGPEIYAANRGKPQDQAAELRIICYNFILESEKFVQYNEELKAEGKLPTFEIMNGRKYWDSKTLEGDRSIIKNKILPFAKTLKNVGRDEPLITLIAQRQWDEFSLWCLKQKPDASPSTINKYITTIYRIYDYAYRKGIVQTRLTDIRKLRYVPADRKRLEITDSDWFKMVEWSRERYQDPDFGGSIKYVDKEGVAHEDYVSEYTDYQYLFHLYILIIANCGIRPPNGGVQHTWIKWKHFEIKSKELGGVLHRPSEKGHTYDAAVLPQALDYWEALRKFQIERNIYDANDGYVFAHPRNKGGSGRGSYSKGDPIQNLGTKAQTGQWAKMLIGIGRPEMAQKGVKQNAKYTYSALRTYYITKRAAEGNVKLENIAKSTGTGLEVIMDHYYRFNTMKQLEQLTKGGFQRPEGAKAIYDKDTGYYVGHTKVDYPSEDHAEEYQEFVKKEPPKP